MQINSLGTGLAVSILLFFPIGFLDFLVAINYFVGNWAWSFVILPYLIYFGLAAILGSEGYNGLGKGLAIGGLILSTLIILGVFFLALMFSALEEFG